ncbi:hypothetical protein EJB05_47347, partial [Eragrostis curvula]
MVSKMSSVVTRSSPPVLVVPSKPTPAGNLPLTSTDKSRLFFSFTSFHVFERQLHEPAETIRRALSEALVHYYPVAGRLAAGANSGDQDVHIACTGEGVAFVSATAICTLQEIRFLRTPLVISMDDLVVRYGGPCEPSDPLVTMQVTEFTCGGYVVGVTWNHGIADAFGLAQFLQAVGEMARGLPSPSVVPVRYDDSFPDIPQLISAMVKRSPAGLEAFNSMTMRMSFAYCDVTIPWSFINRIKEEFRSRNGGRRAACTSFEVVTAAIWQCRTRAINLEPDAPTPIVFSANVRKFVGAKDGYYGNCVISQLVEATSGAVANGAIVDVVSLIKDAKESIPGTLAESREPEVDDELIDALFGYNTLVVTTWGGIGLDKVDFGSGTPARVVPNKEAPDAAICFPCTPCASSDDNGANVVGFCVTDEHVQEFNAELARLR